MTTELPDPESVEEGADTTIAYLSDRTGSRVHRSGTVNHVTDDLLAIRYDHDGLDDKLVVASESDDGDLHAISMTVSPRGGFSREQNGDETTYSFEMETKETRFLGRVVEIEVHA